MSSGLVRTCGRCGALFGLPHLGPALFTCPACTLTKRCLGCGESFRTDRRDAPRCLTCLAAPRPEKTPVKRRVHESEDAWVERARTGHWHPPNGRALPYLRRR